MTPTRPWSPQGLGLAEAGGVESRTESIWEGLSYGILMQQQRSGPGGLPQQAGGGGAMTLTRPQKLAEAGPCTLEASLGRVLS